jgi:ribosomal protein S21
MAINVQIKKNGNENAASVLRRFLKRVRGAGFLQEVRSRRYFTRGASKLRRKQSALTRLERSEKYAEAIKMGQPIEK